MPDLVNPRAFTADAMIGTLNLFFESKSQFVALNLSGQWEAAPGLYFVGEVPVGYMRIEGENFSALGNLGAGLRIQEKRGRLVFGGGGDLSLPTAGDEDAPNLFIGLSYMQVWQRYLPDATTVRGHGDVYYNAGRWFVQGQLGVDYLRVTDESDADGTLKTLHIGVAAGAQATEQIAVVGELTTLSFILDDNGPSEDEEFLHMLEVGGRYDLGRVVLGARLFLPLDGVSRELDIYGLGISVTGKL